MYHEELTDEEIRQAAAFVDVADFIEVYLVAMIIR